MDTYAGKVCIVTGASSGIGAEFARQLAGYGAQVVLFARRQDQMIALLETFTDPTRHLIVPGDITNPQDRENLIRQTLDTYGRIDALINNAGIGSSGQPFHLLDAGDIDQVIGVNLLSILHLTRAALPHMVAQKSGLIINVSSPQGHVALPGSHLYAISKAGLSKFSQVLGREYHQQGIHVLDFRPGFTRSEMITPVQEKVIPRWLPVKDADGVVRIALEAALKGKKDVMTGGLIIRLAMWLDRNLPRIGDRLIRFAPK